MTHGIRRWVRYRLERFLVGGSAYRLAFIMLAIGVVTISSGTLLWLSEGDFSEQGWEEAVWWAFLRMTDPGYLGDDEGVLRRSISTVVTIAGYVLFMGALIAIMTTWLNETLRHLERGLTPVALLGHVVILGWTERTPEILADLLATDRHRLRGFLRRSGARNLTVAILADEVGPRMEADLRQQLGTLYRRSRVILRGGSAMVPEHLDRVDCRHAAAIIVANGFTTANDPNIDPDARLMQILLTLRSSLPDEASGEAIPLVVGPLADARKDSVLAAAYASGRLALLPTRLLLSRMLAQAVSHPGFAAVVDELLDQAIGNEIYLRHFPDLEGRAFGVLAEVCPDAIPLGFTRLGARRADEVVLNPPPATLLPADHLLILLAQDYEIDRRPAPSTSPVDPAPTPPVARELHRLVLLGDNRIAFLVMKELLDKHPALQIDHVSRSEIEPRRRRLSGLLGTTTPDRVHFRVGDITLPETIADCDLASADALLQLGTDRSDSAAEADARSLLVHHVALAEMADHPDAERPHAVVELRSPANAPLLDDLAADCLVGGEIIGHLLAQIALRPELTAVFDQLFSADGATIALPPANRFNLTGITDFAGLRQRVATYGGIALGIQSAEQGMRLNPPGATPLPASRDWEIILISG